MFYRRFGNITITDHDIDLGSLVFCIFNNLLFGQGAMGRAAEQSAR
jgi:hypothetical protein